MSWVNANELHHAVDAFIFDCDGVLWRGESLIEGAISAIKKLRENGKKIFFITNNSTKSRAETHKKFQTLGFTVDVSEILCSSFAAALYFSQHPLGPEKKVYVIGEKGILDELQLRNIPFIGGPEDNGKTATKSPIKNIDFDPDVAAVLVGFDSGLNYYKIQYAQLCLNNNADCKFVATNQDQVKHLTSDQEWAGSGAMVGAIIGCTGKQPIVVGKPSSYLIDYILERNHIDRTRICMVGDRLDTDILFGLNNGLKTVLVLSGVTSHEQLNATSNTVSPHFIAHSIVDLVE